MSSCFNLRLPRPNKAWKIFTSKLRTKLHKLHNNPKSLKNKNPKHIISSTSTLTYPIINPAANKTFVPCNSLSKEYRKIRGGRMEISLPCRGLPFKRKSSRRLRFYSRSCSAAPVFVDRIFVVEPPVMEVLTTTQCEVSSSGKKINELMAAGTSGEEEGGADEMWESLGYESPLMRAIDERAEEFISSFKAEMQVQERMISLRSL